jgi:hypothetical protein
MSLRLLKLLSSPQRRLKSLRLLKLQPSPQRLP